MSRTSTSDRAALLSRSGRRCSSSTTLPSRDRWALDFVRSTGHVAGIEFGNASRCQPAALLDEAEPTDNVDDRTRERLVGLFGSEAMDKEARHG